MKRIALGLFLGGMAVCAANAADPVRAVASKGYVDSVTGLLSGLNTRLDNTSLVAAINDLFSGFSSFELFSNKTQTIDANSMDTQYPSAKAVYDAIQNTHDTLDLGEVGTEGKFIQFLRQDNGKVIASATAFDTVINDETKLHEGTAPTTKAVADAIQGVTYTGGTDINIGTDNKVNATYESLDYDNLNDISNNANKLADGYSIIYVRQTDGQLHIGAKQYINTIDELTANETQAPMTSAVYEAIQAVRGEIPTDVQGEIEDVEYSTNTGFFNKVTQTNGKVSVEEKAFDIVVDDTTGRNTDTAPSTKAVNDALWKKQDKSTADYQIGMANGVWQTLEADEIAALQSGVTLSTVEQVATNTDELNKRVKVQQDVTNTVMVTDETGKIIPAPLAECSDLSSKCVLTYGADGYGWEVIARGNGN